MSLAHPRNVIGSPDLPPLTADVLLPLASRSVGRTDETGCMQVSMTFPSSGPGGDVSDQVCAGLNSCGLCRPGHVTRGWSLWTALKPSPQIVRPPQHY